MVQMHMGPMNRTMLPPNGPPNMGNHVPGNQQQAHSPNYPQQLGRPSSRPSTPGQGVIPNPSPSMAHRIPPGGIPQSINELHAELIRIPNAVLPKLKQELMIPQDKDVSAMTGEEKVDSCISQSAYLFIIPLAPDCQSLSRKVSCPVPARTRCTPTTAKPCRSFLHTSHGTGERSQQQPRKSATGKAEQPISWRRGRFFPKAAASFSKRR